MYRGCDDRSPARHRLQDHVRPTLPIGGEQRHVGRGEHFGQVLVHHSSQEPHIATEIERRDLGLESWALGSVACDYEERASLRRHRSHCVEHQRMSLPRHQESDAHHDLPIERQLEARARRDGIEGTELRAIDSVAQHHHSSRIGARFHREVGERGSDGDHSIGVRERESDLTGETALLRQQIDVRAAHGQHVTQSEALREPCRSEAVRIRVVRVEHVDPGFQLNASHRRPNACFVEHALERNPNLGDHQVARVLDVESAVCLAARCARECAVLLRCQDPRPVRHRCDHLDLATEALAIRQHALAHEDSVAGLGGSREQRCERQDAHAHLERAVP